MDCFSVFNSGTPEKRWWLGGSIQWPMPVISWFEWDINTLYNKTKITVIIVISVTHYALFRSFSINLMQSRNLCKKTFVIMSATVILDWKHLAYYTTHPLTKFPTDSGRTRKARFSQISFRPLPITTQADYSLSALDTVHSRGLCTNCSYTGCRHSSKWQKHSKCLPHLQYFRLLPIT